MSDRELRVRTECDPTDLTVTVHVRDTDDNRVIDLEVERGIVFRDTLLDAGTSSHVQLTERVNCGGHGLCVACGVRARSGEPTPDYWHDDLAARSDYPRLSCRFRIDGSLTVELVEKAVWGGRE